MSVKEESFSQRHGHGLDEPEIVVRDSAPPELRHAVVYFAEVVGLPPAEIRHAVLRTLHVPPEPNRWSNKKYVVQEANRHLEKAEWFEVYDVAESLSRSLGDGPKAREYEDLLNRFFWKNGVGWRLDAGTLKARGEEAFEQTLHAAKEVLEEGGFEAARKEIHEALLDLSRRPERDLTGAIQHSMAALECVAREISGSPKATLGEILRSKPPLVQEPLNTALRKLWGYSSEMGRHVREGRLPSYEEAQLVAEVAAAMTAYLGRKQRKVRESG